MAQLSSTYKEDAAKRWIKDCEEHICVYCKHLFGGCKWTDKKKPVDGWTAEKHNRKGIGGISYQVTSCPDFQYGSMCTECVHGGEDLTEHRPDLCKFYRPFVETHLHRHRCKKCVKGKCIYTDTVCTIPSDMLNSCGKYEPRTTTKIIPDACVNFERRDKHWKSIK